MQLGHALREWDGRPQEPYKTGPSSWSYLSGASSADMNLALVHGDNPDEMFQVISDIDEVGVPTCLFFAGEGKKLSDRVPSEWKLLGSMPFMAADIQTMNSTRDARVRQAQIEDVGAVVGLLAQSFGLQPEEVAYSCVTPIGKVDADMKVWILEEDGQAVSTVMGSRNDDVLSVFCMGTPSQFARRGYGKALLSDVLARAKEDGVALGLLGATAAGKPLYDASGWKTLEEWDLYLKV